MTNKKKTTKNKGGKEFLLIRPGDFCYVTSKDLAEYGLERGDCVMVAGTRSLPIKASDPYLQRIYAIVHIIKDNKILGLMDDRADLPLIDMRSIERITDKEKVEELVGLLNETVH